MQQDTQTSALHDIRLDTLFRLVKASGVNKVLDLGCGSGSFLLKLMADPQFTDVVGLEQSGESLSQARNKLTAALSERPSRLQLVCASYADPQPSLSRFPMAVMIETIEHVPAGRLSAVEHQVFAVLQPGQLLLTTPNSEYNVLYGLRAGEFRDPDHKFEWSRAKFKQWALGVAKRHGYQVQFRGIGEADAELGPPTQLAMFQKR
ncbi:MAG: class I SAM-dependent methyltransferase [Alkalimonas sp.]|nr:class I SAM-dependent methyltransferase [Alkalimonas sp.]